MNEITITVNGTKLTATLYNLDMEHAQAAAIRLMRQVTMLDAKSRARRPTYGIWFISHGEYKIEVIKTIRSLMGLGLKEAKDASEKGQHELCELGSKQEADEFYRALTRAGAEVSIIEK